MLWKSGCPARTVGDVHSCPRYCGSLPVFIKPGDDRQLWGFLLNTFQLASDRFDEAKQTDFWSHFLKSNVFCVSKDFNSQTDLSLD